MFLGKHKEASRCFEHAKQLRQKKAKESQSSIISKHKDLDFSETDIAKLNTIVSSVLELCNFEKDNHEVLNNLKNNLGALLGSEFSQLDSDAGLVLHSKLGSNKEIFIRPVIFLRPKSNGPPIDISNKFGYQTSKFEHRMLGHYAPIGIGKLSLELLKWEESQHNCNTITIDMIREELDSEIDNYIKIDLDVNLCGSGHGWFFASFINSGVFEEKKSRELGVPFGIGFTTKTSYRQIPDSSYQTDCVKLLSTLSLGHVGPKNSKSIKKLKGSSVSPASASRPEHEVVQPPRRRAKGFLYQYLSSKRPNV
jgi:hypothetical protein